MGSQLETIKDSEGNTHYLFDKSSLYDDSQMGDQISDFEVLRILPTRGMIDECPVSKVRSLKNNKIYCMAKIKELKTEEKKKLFQEQIKKITSPEMNHPHLIKYYKIIKDEKDNVYLIYEYMNNADLNSFIKAHQLLQKPIKEEEIWNIFLQSLSGLNQMHEQKLSEIGIKPTNIFLNNEQNVKIDLFSILPNVNLKNYDLKKDIKFFGQYMYKMCFANDFSPNQQVERITIKQKDNSYYSKELIDLVYKMGEQNLSSKELYDLVKNEYVKKFSKNTSIRSVLINLYSFPQFRASMFEKENLIQNNRQNYYFSFWLLKTMKAFKENQNLNQCFDEFRRALASENSKLEYSKEIHPIYLYAFIIEKIHKEFNQKTSNSDNTQDNNINDKYVIHSKYKVEEEDNTNKGQMFQKFYKYTQRNINSIVSKLFFGILKTKRNCDICKSGVYSFSNFFLTVFNLTKFGQGDNVAYNLLKDGFHRARWEEKKLKAEDHVFCNTCLTEQPHIEFNQIHVMNRHMIIYLYRGNEHEVNNKINFSEYMDMNVSNNVDKDAEIKNYVKFELIGCVNRITKNDEEEFIYFTRNPDNKSCWMTSYGERNGQAPIPEMQQYGQVVMLFYNAMDQ